MVRNIFWVLGSQSVVIVAGLVKTLVIPISVGLEDFAHWQIYLFYLAYVGIFTAGYNDGIYLKYGGKKLESLPLNEIRAANVIYLSTLSLISLTLMSITTIFIKSDMQFVFLAISLNVFISGLVSNISLTLQSINKIKTFAFLNSADKIIFLLLLLCLFFQELRIFRFLIIADLASKLVLAAVLIFHYRYLYVGKIAALGVALSEAVTSVRFGMHLMLANFSGMLVLGVGRMIIEHFGTLGSYAFYAFAASMASIVHMSLSTIGAVLYPDLRQKKEQDYLKYYTKANWLLLLFSALMLSCYFPAAAFVMIFAKTYIPVIEFLNAIFVVVVLQSKMQLLTNTFYMALRLERAMLVANVISLILVILLSSLSYAFTHSVVAVAYSTLLAVVVRVYLSERDLRRKMGGGVEWTAAGELAALVGFLGLTSLLPVGSGFLAWSLVLVVTAVACRKRLIPAAEQFRQGFLK
jgi:O-antigen/teichoic acid export membrane protein